MASTTYCVVVAFMLATAVVQANQCSSGGECPSADEPQNVMSLLQRELRMNPTMPIAGLEVESGTVALLEEAIHMLKAPNAMLSTIENMVGSGKTPPFPLINVIKDLIKNDIMPGLESPQVAAALDTTELLNAIEACNNKSKTREGDIERLQQASVNNERSLHAACRDAEKAMYDHNLTHADSYCVKLGVFWRETSPLSITDGSTRDEFVDYVAAANRTNMCATSQVLNLSNGCTAQEEELEDKKAECSANQVSFESAFCAWKIALESNCEDLDSCHSNATTAYDNHVNKTEPLVAKWNVETASLHKILCYCDIWLSDEDHGDNRSQHNATHFDVCKDSTHMTFSMDYGTPVDKVACMSAAANHPGTQGFISQEYGSFTDFVEETVPCPLTVEPTVQPGDDDDETTAAPTTTQAIEFALGEQGELDGCPPGYSGISEEPSCQQAADYLFRFNKLLSHGARGGVQTGPESKAYPGCYFDHGLPYFNTHPHPDGSKHRGVAGQICMLEAP